MKPFQELKKIKLLFSEAVDLAAGGEYMIWS
jgi:hypothetical protein